MRKLIFFITFLLVLYFSVVISVTTKKIHWIQTLNDEYVSFKSENYENKTVGIYAFHKKIEELRVRFYRLQIFVNNHYYFLFRSELY